MDKKEGTVVSFPHKTGIVYAAKEKFPFVAKLFFKDYEIRSLIWVRARFD
jgi:hypothetical protein